MSNKVPHEEQSLEGGLLLWAADWLTVLLLAAGMVFPCLDAYGISGQYGFDFGAVLMFCVFGSLGAAALFTWRHGYWAALGILAAGGLVFWRLWVHLTEDWRRARPPGLADLIDASPWALFLLYALVVLTLGWVVVRVRTWWLAAALTVLPLLPAFQAGVLPAWGAMLAGFAGWGSMLLTDLFGRKDRGSLARARFLSLGGMAALLTVLVMCLPREGYTRPQWATDARANLIQTVNRQMLRFFDQEDLENNILVQLGLDLTVDGGGTASGPGLQEQEAEGPNAIESTGSGAGQRENLLKVGPRQDSERQVMTVRTDQPDAAGRVYLRGVSFDSYTGDSWENSFQSEAQPGLYPALTAPDTPEYTMSIRNSRFRGVWYYPYRFTGGGVMNEAGRILGLDGDEDLSGLISIEEMTTIGHEEYRVTYRPGGPGDGFTPLSGDDAADEVNYLDEGRVYVSDGHWTAAGNYVGGYLSVPSGLDTALAPLLEDIQQQDVTVDERLPEQFRGSVEAAARTARYLSSVAVYDPNTPAMEPGEDFVVHFLTEKRGYCVHFATAGAVLLRMQGIPARYVSGYVADLDGQGRATVRDNDAHAWVEIYLAGYGWYPVEMTPGYNGGVSGIELEGGTEIPDAEEDSVEEPEETPEEEPEEETPEEKDDTPDASEEELPVEEVQEDRAPSAVWKALFGFAVFWAALCAVYLLLLFVRKRDRGDKDTNRSVLNAYGRYKRLRRWGCGEDEELAGLAKKAKFSQHTMTEEEREAAWKCLDEDVKQSRIGQPVRRRWIFAFLCPMF